MTSNPPTPPEREPIPYKQVPTSIETISIVAAIFGAALAMGIKWALPKTVNKLLEHEREQMRRIAFLETELNEINAKLLNQMATMTSLLVGMQAAHQREQDSIHQRFWELEQKIDKLCGNTKAP